MGQLWSDSARAIRVQVMLFVSLAHIHHPFKNYYRRTYGTCEGQALRWSMRRSLLGGGWAARSASSSSATSESSGESSAEDQVDKRRFESVKERRPEVFREMLRRRQKELASARRRKFNAFERAPDAAEWQWRGVPQECVLMRIYNTLSTIWMCYACIRFFFSRQLYALAEWLLGDLVGLPGHCMVAGNLVLILDPTLDPLGSFVFATFHLVWRSYQRFGGHTYMMSLFVFQMQSESDLDKFYKIMDENKHSAYLTSSNVFAQTSWRRKYWSESSELGATSPIVPKSSAEFDDGRDILSTPMPSLSPKQDYGRGARMMVGARGDEVGVHEHFMRNILCYQVQQDNRVVYKLRPNRTREAKPLLSRLVSRLSLVSLCSYLMLALPVAIIITILILSDHHYIHTYPGCSPALESLRAQNKLSLWSVTLTGHHIFTALCDGLENLFIWVDSGTAITFVAMIMHMMNSDILLYWRHLHVRLESVLERVRSQSEMRAQIKLADQLEQERPIDIERPMLVQLGSPRSNTRTELSYDRLQVAREDVLITAAEINELQFELYDFFQQVERADMTISDVITTVILVWLCSCVVLSYQFFARAVANLPPAIKGIQALGFIVILLATKYLLQLRKCCMKSYRPICALIAHDQEPKIKRQFIKVLDFFTERNRTTYTLFHHYPYLATTFATTMGWSISCFFIIYALFGRKRAG